MLDSASIAMIVGLVFCVIMSGYFSATETAFTSLNRVRLKSWADGGDQRAARTLALAEDYDKLLSTLLIGNNIVNNVATTIGAVLFIHLIDEVTGPTVSAIVLTVVILIFGEVSPKSLAKESPERFAMFATPLLGVLRTVLTPLNFLFTQWKRLLSKVFRKSADGGITEEELVTLVDQAESEGGLDQHESKLIRAAIEFHDLEVEEILTPRVDIVAVEDSASMEEIAAVFAESGYSRLPVYHKDVDDIVGVIHEKDFNAARYRGQGNISGCITPVHYTTANADLGLLLRTLQKKKTHMAIVVDEYGGTEGLLTMEDILEELVGEIWDEHDEVVESFRKQSDGSFLVAAGADLSDLYDLFSIKGDCDASTVSGWVIDQLGRLPLVGDHFQAEGLDVTVTMVDHRRVLEVRVAVAAEAPDVLIVDSIQTLYNDALESPAGSVSQVKDCTMALMQLAKGQGITVFVIGHVNKEGSIAGPKVLEHMVDCVLYFEGDQHTAYRILRAAKNRFGATNEIGVFEMRDSGLVEVENPSEMLLSGRPEDAPGTCVTCVMEGARPVLAEIQALAVSSPAGNPRRTSNGFDYNRFAMLLAVLEKRGGLKVSACDAYLNIIGGLSLDEPAADLAAVIALASSYLDRPVPADLVAIGEVGLTGELRSVSQLGQRVSEVRRLGFTQCLIPSRRTGELAAPAGLRLIPVRNIGEAIRAALRPSE